MANVTLLSHSPNPELYIAAAAKLCYSHSDIETLLDNLTPEKTEAFLQKLVDLGHESPIEHVTFTFGIEGVSRSLLAQITRHRIASFSVQSQRYVVETDMKYVTPPEIAAIPEAAERYQKAMNDAEAAYHELTDILMAKHMETMLASGMSEKAARSAAEKKAIEDARFVLPNACETKMIVTMNARSLYNFFHLRCCSRAQWEIRAVATEMLRQVKAVCPTLFANCGPRCVSGPCPEGKMSCGKAAEVRAYFKGL